LKRNPENIDARINLGNAYGALGRADGSRGSDPRKSYRRAITEFDEVLKMNPGNTTAYVNRATTFIKLGLAANSFRLDPRQAYRKAIADCHEALKRSPELALAHYNCGCAHLNLGKAEASLGQDPRESFRKAVAAFGEELRRNPTHGSSYLCRGDAYLHFGDAECARGQDPRALFEKAIADYGEGLKLDPRKWRCQANQGILLEKMGRYKEAVAPLESALRGATGDGVPLVREMLARARRGVQAPSWARDIFMANSCMRDGNYQVAPPLYEKGLAAAEEASAFEEERHIQFIIVAHNNLATAYALLSGGRRSLLGKPKPFPAAEAASLRAKALATLRKAIELGFTGLEHVRKSPDFASLRDRPAFKALLAEWEEKLKKKE
jgi:tetratricopeptide (TPR) repeat protein